jgi:phage tail sheath gpL-like
LTCTGAPTAAQHCSINNVLFTARASGATGNEFNIGANVTASATNLAAAINASSSTKLLNSIVATSAAGVVTITARIPGFAGLGYHISAGTLDNATATDFALASESQRVTF